VFGRRILRAGENFVASYARHAPVEQPAVHLETLRFRMLVSLCKDARRDSRVAARGPPQISAQKGDGSERR
jgi:hypothetical protein